MDNVAVDEAVATSGVNNEVETLEKVFIDSDRNRDNYMINNKTITAEEQLNIADKNSRQKEFKMVSKKWRSYRNYFTDENGYCYVLTFRRKVNLTWSVI